MHNIHCQWHTLKTCIVGRTYHADFFRGLHPGLARICNETEEDLQNICSVLGSFNVEVLRPQLDRNDHISNYTKSSAPKPPIAPRDAHVVIGDKTFEFGPIHPSIAELIPDAIRSPFHRSRHESDVPAPSITQLGRDLLIDEKCFGHWEMQWLQNQLPGYRFNSISIGGHNDGSFIILKPGVVISLPETIDWETHFPGWSVLEINHDGWDLCRDWLQERKLNNGRWWLPGQEDDDKLARTVEDWLSNWMGYAAESVFSLNALIVDESNVIVNTARRDVIDFMRSHDINPIICPLRHQYFWDNGIHCMTLDLHREGNTFDLFPDRKYPFICSGF